MKVLGLLAIFFILEVRSRDLRAHVTNTICLAGCKCQNTNNASLEISNCLRPIDINSDFNRSSSSFSSIRFNQVTIDNLTANAFNFFSDLEHVEFNSSIIKNMQPQAFFRDELSSLTFTYCKFWNLPNIQCLDLEELVMTNSNLKRIPKFEDLPSLTILHLDGNRINTIKDKTFMTLESLEEIYLTNNEISTLSSKLFFFNTQLMILDLSHNLLSSYALEGITNLEILSLANNQLNKFNSSASKYLKNLRSLDLSHNKISLINQETFINMPSLEMINLGYNKLNVLENNTFSYNSYLEKLILDGNNFKTLPIFESHTDIFQNIYNFSCRKCGIVSLSSFTFGSMPGLLQITLAENNLEILDPKAFGLVSSLRILDLSGNKLRKLGGNIFSDNKELLEINLSGNPLKTLDPKDFIDLKNLRKLDASNAQLTSLWVDNYEYVLKLEQLIISNNSIEDITTDDLKVIPHLKYIDLEYNPIQCTIHLANLIKWLTIHEVYSTEGASLLRTNEKLLDDAAQYLEDSYDHKSHWQKLAKIACIPSDNELKNRNTDIVMNMIIQNAREIDSVPKVNPPKPAEDESTAEDIEDNYRGDDGYSVDDPEAEAIELGDIIEVKDDFNLNQATYIISVTSVFVITALIVLSAAVSIILVILRKHNTLNINSANLPRIKIPRWETMPSQKKHSGSVYRPLSEEILAPPTPKVNRYEFKTTPPVHNFQP